MNNLHNLQTNNQGANKSVPLILRNPAKAILVAAIIGLGIGLILGILVAFLNSTAPPSTVEPANVIQRHSTLFIIIAFPLGFGILGFSLGILSWISTKFPSKTS